MIKNLRKEKGITMITVTISVIILLIITGILVYNARDAVYIKNYNGLKNDIELLRDKVAEFYNEYGSIPAKTKCAKISTGIESVFNQTELNNEGDLYVLDLQVLDGVTLNYGKDYEAVKNMDKVEEYYPNLYIIHKMTHNIFLMGGVEVKEGNTTKFYYTDYSTPDETKVDFRYVDGIKIPDGYYYIGRNDEGNITIGTTLEEEYNSESQTQYVWRETSEVLQNAVLEEGQTLEEYKESVEKYKGYYLNSKTNKIIYLNANNWSETYTSMEKYVDKNGDTAYIPKGFQVSKQSGTNMIKDGLVIRDQTGDETTNGSEFVWIPVENMDNFHAIEGYLSGNLDNKLSKITEAGGENSTIKTAESIAMYNSVEKYGGFYIARYEAGITDESLKEVQDGTVKPISKKGATSWKNIGWGGEDSDKASDGLVGDDSKDGAVKVARSMYNDSNLTNARSTLIYGVQWDATLNFIDPNYINGTCEETSFVRNSKNKGNHSGTLIRSGENDKYKVKNIYDLAGNLWEWTMEAYDGTARVRRGGEYYYQDNRYPASCRGYDTPSAQVYNSRGFRVALYLQ